MKKPLIVSLRYLSDEILILMLHPTKKGETDEYMKGMNEGLSLAKAGVDKIIKDHSPMILSTNKH